MCTEVFVRDDEKVLGIVVMVSEHCECIKYFACRIIVAQSNGEVLEIFCSKVFVKYYKVDIYPN